jgi:hypothetical protein
MKQAAEAAGKPELMGKERDALSPEQKADLANLAERQKEVARGCRTSTRRWTRSAKKLDESDPLAASAMRGAAQESRQQGTAAKMGDAAERLEQNQMGSARPGQEQARQDSRSSSTRSRTAANANSPGSSRS